MAVAVLAACGGGDDGGVAADAADVAAADGSHDAAPDVGVDVEVDAIPGPDPALWPDGPAFAPSTTGFAARHPSAFERLSRWVTQVSGPIEGRPDVGHRGGYGVGNGWTFGLIGLADPLNTLHGLVGPTYERRPDLFGDYWITLDPAGAEVAPFDAEWATRSLAAPIVLTRATRGDLVLETADFAPASDALPARRCFLRVITVTNAGASPSTPHVLRVRAYNATSAPAPSALLEQGPERTLTTAFVGGGGEVVDGALTLPVAELAPADAVEVTLAHCAAGGEHGPPVGLPLALDVDALVEATVSHYAAWESGLVAIEVPDPRVADFIDGMKQTLRVQTSAQGASCPMSQYTRTWARDNIGPALALLDLGAHEDVEAMMDYLWAAVLREGDLRNSYAADLDTATDGLPPAPDWEAMAPLGGKVAAETPSYMVWIYGAHWRHTGAIERATARWGFLRRAQLAQGVSPEGFLPFTGDETFRAAMNAAYGWELEVPHHEESWSTNSSLLWLGAARHFEALAVATGQADAVAAAEAQRALIEGALMTELWLADGCVAPGRDRATGETWAAPFEDVALKVTWAGWLDGDDPLARDALGCLLERLRVAPGRLQSALHESYQDHPILPNVQGVYTGMLPGYTLSALAAAGHPEAAAAFDALGESLGSSGNLQEYQIFDDHSGLSLAYDQSGLLGDYTAKFRPWEGGIGLHAAFEYLLGWDPHRADRHLALRPHLPNDWPHMAFRGLRIGADRFDVEVARTAGGHAVRVTSGASADAYTLTLRWDAPAGAPLAVTVDGVAPAAADVERVEHFGQQSVRAVAIALPPGATVEIAIE